MVCIVLASYPSLYLSRIGANLFDEPYQILNGLDYKNAPMAPLSNYLGNLFGTTFGWEWIKFRYLAYGIHKLAILIGCWYMWHRTKKYWPCLILTTATMIISSIFQTAPNLYGWDAWTLPFVVCAIIATIEHLRRNRNWILIVLGIISAIAGLCRIPNFAIVVAISAILLYPWEDAQPLKVRIRQTSIYLATAIVASLVIITLLYESPINYLTYIKANSIDDHNLKGMIYSYIHSSLSFVIYPSLIWSCYLITKKAYSKRPAILYITCFAILCVLIFFLIIHTFGCFGNIHEFIIGLNLTLILTIYHYDKKSLKYLVAIFLLACIPFLGSNTGILKFIILPLLPILYTFIHKYITKTMVTFGTVCFTSFILYSCVIVRHHSFMDVGTIEAKYEFSDGLAKGIRTSAENGKEVDGIMNEMKPYRSGYNIIVMRKEPHYIYEYLLQSRNDYLRHRFSGVDDNNKDYATWLRSEIAKGGDKVAILRLGDCDESSLISETLDQLCAKTKITEKYTIYVKKQKIHE